MKQKSLEEWYLTMTNVDNQRIRRSLRLRLQLILEEEEKQLRHWNEVVRHNIRPSTAASIERKRVKHIQALKIVIHMMTPFYDRTEDVPSFIVKKDKSHGNRTADEKIIRNKKK